MRGRFAFADACVGLPGQRSRRLRGVFAGMVTALALVLGGCAAPPSLRAAEESPSHHFELSARLSIRVEQKLDLVNIRWTRAAGQETIVLLSPLGSTVARLEQRTGQQAVLDEGRGPTRQAESIAALVKDVLGQPVPLEELAWWMQGWQAGGKARLPAGEFPHGSWTVAIEAGADGRVQRLNASQGDLRLRLVLDTWEPRP